MSQQKDEAGVRSDLSVSAAIPIAILESVRAYDRPGEFIEDEDVTLSMPRRLGLTGIVGTQIMRYEAALRSGRDVRLDETMGLLRLVMRRPDSEPILRETGERIARWRFRNTPDLWQTLLHRGPDRFAIRSARRAAGRTLRALHAGSEIHADRPFSIRVTGCRAADFAEGPACAMYTSMFEEQLLLYTGEARQVEHVRCGEECVWEMVPDESEAPA